MINCLLFVCLPKQIYIRCNIIFNILVEIVSAPPPPKISKAHLPTPPPPDISREKSPSPKSGGSQLSLSVEETNKLRAKLGLAPLDVHDAPKSDLNVFKDDLGEFHHKPAPNKKDEARAKKIKEKLSIWREKRQIETKLAKVKKLGESDSEDDARTWIEKNRKMQVEKKKAEERVKIFVLCTKKEKIISLKLMETIIVLGKDVGSIR